MEDNLFNLDISIEKMAAYLDGNLSADEMLGMSSLIESNNDLRMFVDASSVVDDTLSSYSDIDGEIPFELQSMDFDLPSLDCDFQGLVTLSPEPSPFLDDMMVAASANAPVEGTIQQLGSEDHVSAFSDDTIIPKTGNTFEGLSEDL